MCHAHLHPCSYKVPAWRCKTIRGMKQLIHLVYTFELGGSPLSVSQKEIDFPSFCLRVCVCVTGTVPFLGEEKQKWVFAFLCQHSQQVTVFGELIIRLLAHCGITGSVNADSATWICGNKCSNCIEVEMSAENISKCLLTGVVFFCFLNHWRCL